MAVNKWRDRIQRKTDDDDDYTLYIIYFEFIFIIHFHIVADADMRALYLYKYRAKYSASHLGVHIMESIIWTMCAQHICIDDD